MNFIAGRARGYLYYVSFKGITGADRLDQAGITRSINEIRRHTSLPLAVGFGIKGPESAAAVARVADAVVIGSALVRTLAVAASPGEAMQLARAFLAPVRAAMDNDRAKVQQSSGSVKSVRRECDDKNARG
jgi:tryptophan synthase alpha chain